jgi:2'-5' RNA ligase
MMRLFAALPIPPDICAPLRALQRDLPGARWRPEANFHITLCFYGDLSFNQARDLDELLGAVEAPAFEISLEGAGWFGRREPTAVWARVRETDELSGLAAACARAARRLGLRLERQPFTPHVTLAYCQATPLEDARRWTERHHAFRAGPWLAGSFHLYSSQPGKTGVSRYVPEADYPLAGPFSGLTAPEGMY